MLFLPRLRRQSLMLNLCVFWAMVFVSFIGTLIDFHIAIDQIW